MELSRQWGDGFIRQNKKGYFLGEDIVNACRITNYNYLFDNWMQLGISLLANSDKKILYIPWFSRDKENNLWVCPMLAQELARRCDQLDLAVLIGHDSWGIDWANEEDLNSSLQGDMNREKPKPLMDSNEFHWFCNVISCLEETGIPEDTELARLLRENLRSKI